MQKGLAASDVVGPFFVCEGEAKAIESVRKL
jgi:hypothetical protein